MLGFKKRETFDMDESPLAQILLSVTIDITNGGDGPLVPLQFGGKKTEGRVTHLCSENDWSFYGYLVYGEDRNAYFKLVSIAGWGNKKGTIEVVDFFTEDDHDPRAIEWTI